MKIEMLKAKFGGTLTTGEEACYGNFDPQPMCSRSGFAPHSSYSQKTAWVSASAPCISILLSLRGGRGGGGTITEKNKLGKAKLKSFKASTY